MSKRTTDCEAYGAEAPIRQYLSGTLAEPDQETFEEHLLSCDTCQEDLRLAVAIREGLRETEPLRISDRRGRKFRVLLGTALAAAATVALVVALPSPQSGHRAADAEVSSLPTPVEPVGEIETIDRLTWRRSSDADGYRPAILDAEGRIVWEGEVTADSFAILPTDLQLHAGEPYYWKVDGRIGFDRWAESSLASFTVRAAPAVSPR